MNEKNQYVYKALCFFASVYEVRKTANQRGFCPPLRQQVGQVHPAITHAHCYEGAEIKGTIHQVQFGKGGRVSTERLGCHNYGDDCYRLD